MSRISRNRLWAEHALLEAKRSSCLKRQVGCVAVKDNRVIASGYNGVLAGVNPRFGIDEEGNTLTVHAEANLIAFAANIGISLRGSTLFTTLEPCRKCAELIIQSGFTHVYYIESYRVHDGLELLANSLIQVIKLDLVNEPERDYISKLITIGNYNG